MLFLRPINNYFKTNKTFSQLFDNFVNDNEFSVFGSFKIDIKEENDSYILEAELPGLKKEEIKVEYRDEQLSIYVNREEKTDEQKENYIHRERKIASMKRSFWKTVFCTSRPRKKKLKQTKLLRSNKGVHFEFPCFTYFIVF